jgi:DNA-directed RNA polymerase specialized sigma24 family protein
VEPNLRARIRAGDPDAFGLIFDEYARAVYNLGLRLTANWSAAEDVVSLTFLEAWRLRTRIDPGGESLRPWLLGIAVNVCRNLARGVAASPGGPEQDSAAARDTGFRRGTGRAPRRHGSPSPGREGTGRAS